MKIAFLTSEYPHPRLKRSAGIGSSIRNLASGLVEQGCEVIVFVVFQDQDAVFSDGQIRIHSIARKGYRLGGWYLERQYIQRQIQLLVSEENVQLIEAPEWTGITAFMTFSIPVVIRMHGSDAYFCQLEGRKQKIKHYWFERQALKQADHLISVSRFTADRTRALFKLKKPIHIIYNGIDTRSFIPDHSEVLPGRLLYFGSLLRKKGVLELAQIFNLVHQANIGAELVLVGKDNADVLTGRSTKALFLDKLDHDARHKVNFLEEVAYEDIKEHIAQAEIVVLPSLAEAFPMTWLETLSMEKPLVSSSIGWAQELMIHGRTGFTAHPSNHRVFADRILELLSDKEKRYAFGKEGRKHVSRNFSLDKIIDDNLRFYKSVID